MNLTDTMLNGKRPDTRSTYCIIFFFNLKIKGRQNYSIVVEGDQNRGYLLGGSGTGRRHEASFGALEI